MAHCKFNLTGCHSSNRSEHYSRKQDRVLANTLTHAHTHARTHAHTHTRTRTRTCTRTHTHTHTHTHTELLQSMSQGHCLSFSFNLVQGQVKVTAGSKVTARIHSVLRCGSFILKSPWKHTVLLSWQCR